MSVLAIDTGTIALIDSATEIVNSGKPVATERIIYPNASLDGSSIITVSSNTMVIVTAYVPEDIDEDEEGDEFATISKVLLAEIPSGITGSPCDLKERVEELEVLAEARICGYDLKKCSPVAILDVPGAYKVIPNNPNSGIIISAVAQPLAKLDGNALRGA